LSGNESKRDKKDIDLIVKNLKNEYYYCSWFKIQFISLLEGESEYAADQRLHIELRSYFNCDLKYNFFSPVQNGLVKITDLKEINETLMKEDLYIVKIC
jgi:hypothetical protein